MPRIIEGRRRGCGGGTRGILADGDQFYQRRESESKPYWSEPQQPTTDTTEPQIPNPDSSSTTAPDTKTAPQEATNDKQITIDEAKSIFQKRKARTKKRFAWFSPTGELEDFSFGSMDKNPSKPKPQQPQHRRKSSLSPFVSTGTSNYPMVTPAASIASLVDHDVPTSVLSEVTTTSVDNHGAKHESTRESPLSWQSPRPHSPALNESHKQEMESLKESHCLQMEELLRKHREKTDEQIQKFKSEAQHWKDKCEEKDAAIKELKEQHSQSEKTKEENHSKLLRETVGQLEEKHKSDSQARDKEHAKALKEAIEAERARLATMFEVEKKSRDQQIILLRQELECCKIKLQSLDLESLRGVTCQQPQKQILTTSGAQRETNGKMYRQENDLGSAEGSQLGENEAMGARENKDIEHRNRIEPILEKASSYFAKDDKANTPPSIHRLPLVERFAVLPHPFFQGKKKPMPALTLPMYRSPLAGKIALPLLTNSSQLVQTNLAKNSDNPFRSSDKTFELFMSKQLEKTPKKAETPEAIINTANLLMCLSGNRDGNKKRPLEATSLTEPAAEKPVQVKNQDGSVHKKSQRRSPRSKTKSSPRKPSLREVLPSFSAVVMCGEDNSKMLKRRRTMR